MWTATPPTFESAAAAATAWRSGDWEPNDADGWEHSLHGFDDVGARAVAFPVTADQVTAGDYVTDGLPGHIEHAVEIVASQCVEGIDGNPVVLLNATGKRGACSHPLRPDQLLTIVRR